DAGRAAPPGGRSRSGPPPPPRVTGVATDRGGDHTHDRSRPRGFWAAQPRWAVAAVAVVGAGASLWMFLLTWLRYRAWFGETYDIGIFNQAMWLLSHFKEPFVTVRVSNVFGDHASLNLLPLVPFYRLWPFSGASFLYGVQAVAMGSAVVPLYRLAVRAGAAAI